MRGLTKIKDIAKKHKLDLKKLCVALHTSDIPMPVAITSEIARKLKTIEEDGIDEYNILVSKGRKIKIDSDSYIMLKEAELPDSDEEQERVLSRSINDLYIHDDHLSDLTKIIEDLKKGTTPQTSKRSLRFAQLHEEIDTAIKNTYEEMIRSDKKDIKGTKIAKTIDDRRHKWPLLKAEGNGTSYDNILKRTRFFLKNMKNNIKE